MKWQKRLRVPVGAAGSLHVALSETAAARRGSAHDAPAPSRAARL